MFQSIRHSLLLRVGLIMVVLTALAVTSMTTSVWIGRTLQGEASAVNIAGSLRMLSYRIATHLLRASQIDEQTHWQRMQGLVQNFEGRLNGRRLAKVLPDAGDHHVRLAFVNVERQWRGDIKPLLDDYISGIIPAGDLKPRSAPRTWGMISDASVATLRARYLAKVPRFVDRIDDFVKALELDAEAKARHLRYYQWAALAMTLSIVAIALTLVSRKVLHPLQQLLSCASAAGRGDFSVRAAHTGKDELGRLGRAFNDMSQTLSALYRNLEERVQEKTKDLEHSNRSLEVLYNTVNRLSTTPYPHLAYQGLLEEITTLARTGPASICLIGIEKATAHQLATTEKSPACSYSCAKSNCAKCLGKGSVHSFKHKPGDGKMRSVISIPIQDAQNSHGVLVVEALDENGFAQWQARVLEAVASHIGIAITMSGRNAEQSRLALLEERSAIARELHDSLAQSLSYAKIQVGRLNSVIKHKGAAQYAGAAEAGRDPGGQSGAIEQLAQAREINNELRDGLNRAYKELRELLTTFRLTMDDHDLNRSIRDTVQEFASRGAVAISFTSDCPAGLLTPNEEIHILQIIREALANVVQHSRAKTATVRLSRARNNIIELSITDDGAGLGQAERSGARQHYGLVIMRERAANLAGTLTIEDADPGTKLDLVFTSSAQIKPNLARPGPASSPGSSAPGRERIAANAATGAQVEAGHE